MNHTTPNNLRINNMLGKRNLPYQYINTTNKFQKIQEDNMFEMNKNKCIQEEIVQELIKYEHEKKVSNDIAANRWEFLSYLFDDTYQKMNLTKFFECSYHRRILQLLTLTTIELKLLDIENNEILSQFRKESKILRKNRKAIIRELNVLTFSMEPTTTLEQELISKIAIIKAQIAELIKVKKHDVKKLTETREKVSAKQTEFINLISTRISTFYGL